MPQNRYGVLIYWSEEDQAFIAEVPDLPGCMADGRTRRECLANVETVIKEWIETAHELGRAVPQPRGRLMTISEAAQRLRLSAAMTRRYCSEGRLPAQKIGRDWALYEHDVDAFASRSRNRGRPAQWAPARA